MYSIELANNMLLLLLSGRGNRKGTHVKMKIKAKTESSRYFVLEIWAYGSGHVLRMCFVLIETFGQVLCFLCSFFEMFVMCVFPIQIDEFIQAVFFFCLLFHSISFALNVTIFGSVIVRSKFYIYITTPHTMHTYARLESPFFSLHSHLMTPLYSNR